jgi:hypothetical protein
MWLTGRIRPTGVLGQHGMVIQAKDWDKSGGLVLDFSCSIDKGFGADYRK